MIKKNTFTLYLFGSIIGAITLALLLFIGYYLSISNQHLFTISMLALTGGLLFESLHISDKWIHVVYILLVTFIFSFVCFLRGKTEYDYNFENHLRQWPNFFIGSFLLTSTFVNRNSQRRLVNV